MRILFLLAFLFLGIQTGIAQDRDQDKDQDRDQTRLMMVDGDLLQIRDQDQQQLQDKITLNDGTVLSPNGAYVTRDGKRLRLKNGECLDMDGVKYNNEYQYRFKVQQENKGLSEAQIQERNQNRVQYSRIDGDMYQIRNQSQNRVQDQVNVGDGISVRPDGTYQIRNQQQMRLQDGECLNMDGEKLTNMYQLRKNMVQKNMMQNKVQNKMQKNIPKNVQKQVQKNPKKGKNN